MTRLTLPCLLILLALTGCGTEPPPDLLARVMQDCEAGNSDACSILRGLPASAASPTVSSPRPARRLRSQVQQNVDALMQGVERARNAPRLAPNPVPENGPI